MGGWARLACMHWDMGGFNQCHRLDPTRPDSTTHARTHLEAKDVLGLGEEDVDARAGDEAREHGGRDELHERADPEEGHAAEDERGPKRDDGRHLPTHVGVVPRLRVEHGVLVLGRQRDAQLVKRLRHEERHLG